MKVAFRASFTSDLKGASKSLLKKVRKVIEATEKANALDEIPNLIKLTGRGNYFRIRAGDYRIGLVLEGDTLIFVRCLDRKDIYRYFP